MPCRTTPYPFARNPAGCHLNSRMVYLESSVAAAFTLGSAGCLLQLALPHHHQQPTQSAQLVFVTCLLVICVLSTFALWSVEGRHACWHHGCAGGSTGGKEVAPERPPEAPRSCAQVLLKADSNDDDDLPSEEFPLERRSSFVVSFCVTRGVPGIGMDFRSYWRCLEGMVYVDDPFLVGKLRKMEF